VGEVNRIICSADGGIIWYIDADAVAIFCSQHDLFQDVGRGVAMVKKTLHPRRLRLVVEGDPEGSGEWLVLEVDMQGSVDEVLGSYHRFKDQWLTGLSAAGQKRMRLLVNIV